MQIHAPGSIHTISPCTPDDHQPAHTFSKPAVDSIRCYISSFITNNLRDQVIKMMNLRDVTRLSKWWKYVKMMNLHGASTWGYHNQLQTWWRVEISYPVTCMVTTTGQGYESYRCHLELQADYGRSKARRCEVCSKGGQHSVAICTATQDTNHKSPSLISLWFLWT